MIAWISLGVALVALGLELDERVYRWRRNRMWRLHFERERERDAASARLRAPSSSGCVPS